PRSIPRSRLRGLTPPSRLWRLGLPVTIAWRKRKGSPGGPLVMSGIFKDALFPAALLEGATFLF
ncbi:MAG: hypothetical protein WAT93_08280, partial [Pontixanthobacter sp.]